MNSVRRFDYFLSALPSLEGLGSLPPLDKSTFRSKVAEVAGPTQTVDVLLLEDDLKQREALLAKALEPRHAELAVLDADGLLPEDLASDQGKTQDDPRASVDALWSRYFHFAARVARRHGSPFLTAWIGFEVGLRNALAFARAEALSLDPTGYLVTPELGDTRMDASNIVAAWTAAPHPLAALEVLDEARWEWLTERGDWYGFRAAEIEAYAAKLILLHRWWRLTEKTHQRTAGAA